MQFDPETTSMKVEELAKLSFSFPALQPNSPAGCPQTEEEVREYAQMETDEAEALTFVGTYDIDDVHYWVWKDAEGQHQSYIFIEEYEGSVTLGCNMHRGLTPEQFLVREHLRLQYGRRYE